MRSHQGLECQRHFYGSCTDLLMFWGIGLGATAKLMSRRSVWKQNSSRMTNAQESLSVSSKNSTGYST